MKKLFFSIVCIVTLLFSACSDFLEKNPKNSLPPAEGYFINTVQIEAAVNNLYRLGPNSWTSPGVYNGNRLMQGGWCSGLFDNLDYKGQEVFIQYVQQLTGNEDNLGNRMNEMYNDPYVAISRANLILDVLPNVDKEAILLSESNYNRFLAEARFFRAQNYFWLVKHWGDVTMVTKPQVAEDDLNLPRTSAKTIYDEVIVPDLQNAVSVLRRDASQYGNSMRITASIASAHLIDVYIQMTGYPVLDASKWPLAAAEAKKFLPGGAYAPLYDFETHEDFGELSAYNKLRNVGIQAAPPPGRVTSSSKEFIYVQDFNTAQGSTAGFSANAWPVAVSGLGTTESILALTNNAYRPVARRLAVYDETQDLRMKEKQFFATTFVKKDGSELVLPNNNIPSPYFYYDYGQIKVSNTSNRHFPHYRLAEMYLFAAEAIAQTEGVTAQAVDALATIRARAYVYGAGDIEKQGEVKTALVAELSGLSKDDFIKEVWLERYRELVFEFKDWSLIQRTRLYPKTNPMDDAIPVGTAQFVDFTSVGTDWSGTRRFTLDHLLLPLPFAQIQRNPNLKQNPGYSVTQL